MSISNAGFWIGIVTAGQIGPILVTTPLQISGTFLVFSAIALLLFLHVLFLVPETKVGGRGN